MRFTKGQDIRIKKPIYLKKTRKYEYGPEMLKFTCILCDEEFACFAELTRGGGAGFSIDMENTFIVSNLKDFEDGFKYELV